jgi:formate/nitrite transporter FocA (FNT family)
VTDRATGHPKSGTRDPDKEHESAARAEEKAEEKAEERRARRELEGSEVAQAERRSAPAASVVYEAVRREGQSELRRPVQALAWSGLAAGLSMGFSGLAQALLGARLPAADWRITITSFGYSVGFMIVILGRQQLFTENTLTAILPLLREKTIGHLGRVARLWGVVLGANLVGAAIFALVLESTSILDPAVKAEMGRLGQAAIGGSFADTMLAAIFAGWLIALIVWLLPFAETARILVIIIITYVIGLGHFPHIIAGSVEVLYSVYAGAFSFGDYLRLYFAPTLIGNVVGGVSLVAAINHAQVVAGRQD